MRLPIDELRSEGTESRIAVRSESEAAKAAQEAAALAGSRLLNVLLSAGKAGTAVDVDVETRITPLEVGSRGIRIGGRGEGTDLGDWGTYVFANLDLVRLGHEDTGGRLSHGIFEVRNGAHRGPHDPEQSPDVMEGERWARRHRATVSGVLPGVQETGSSGTRSAEAKGSGRACPGPVGRREYGGLKQDATGTRGRGEAREGGGRRG